MALARSIIPSKYKILTNAYRSLLPDLPEDMYPAILQVVHDHDVRFGDYRLDDFSVSISRSKNVLMRNLTPR